MKSFNKENINRIINDFKNDKIKYLNDIENVKGIDKITKRLPNFFTKLRFLAPFVILPITLSGNYLLSLKAISLFAITDILDGFTARKFDAYSEYGRKLDTISDKIFSIGIAIPIIFINPSFISILLLETMIGLVSIMSELKQNHPFSTKLGKIKTWFTFTSLISGYAINIFNFNQLFLNLLLVSTNIFQISTLVQYTCMDKKEDQKKEIINNDICNNNTDKIKELKELKNYLNNMKNEKEFDISQKQKKKTI